MGDDQQRGGAARRGPRADALQNRARILTAAEARFASDGLNAQIDDIARDAGVAAGTIYHHFGSKEALLAAIGRNRFQRMAEHIGALLRDADPWAGFEAALLYVAERQVNDRTLKEALLAQPGVRESVGAGMREILLPAIAPALERAQAAGLVRADVRPADLPPLLAGLPGPAADPADRARYLAIILAGLRTAPSG